MTAKVTLDFYDSTAAYPLTDISWDGIVAGTPTSAVQVIVTNTGAVATTETRLNASRCDFVIADPVGEDAAATCANGGELASESWVEAKLLAGDPWTPIDEHANSLVIAPAGIAVGASVSLYLRLNVPAGATTFGDMDFALIVRSRTA